MSFIQENTFLRYHPESFNDSDNNRTITRNDMVKLLENNASIGKCISEQIYDQKSISTYFDCDINNHLSNTTEISDTLDRTQDTIYDLFNTVCNYRIMIALSSVYKSTKHGPKLSIHCVVWNVQMTINGLYDLIHDNIELLESLNFNCSVHKRFMKRQKFRCVNICKENEKYRIFIETHYIYR